MGHSTIKIKQRRTGKGQAGNSKPEGRTGNGQEGNSKPEGRSLSQQKSINQKDFVEGSNQPEDTAKISTRLKCGIQLSEQGICPALSRDERHYVKARYAESLDKLPEPKAIQYIVEILNRSYAELGHVPVGSGIHERANLMKATAGLIRNDLLFHYPKVTLEEIDNAVRRGIRREYGDYYGFNAISVHEFVKKYLNSEDRLNALDRQARYLNSHAPPEEISQEAKDELMKAGLEQCRETYRKTGRIIDFGNVNYHMLEQSGEINLSPEERLEIYHEAQMQLKAELDAQAVSFHQIVSRMRANQSDEAAIDARAKEISLRRHFEATAPLGAEEVMRFLTPFGRTGAILLKGGREKGK